MAATVTREQIQEKVTEALDVVEARAS